MIRVDVDTTGLEEHERRFVETLDPIARAWMGQAEIRIEKLLTDQVDEGRKGPFSASDRLGSDGALLRALSIGGQGNLRVVAGADGVYRLEYGVGAEMARRLIGHETGMFVRHKGRMPFYLLRLARETGDDRYRIIALSALKKGGIQLKKRPVFAPAKAAIATESQKRAGELGRDITQTWEETR